MRLYATGFNGHAQLNNNSTDDAHAFAEVAAKVSEICLATWSTLTWAEDSLIVTQGHQRFTIPLENFHRPHSWVGNHNGVLGMLDANRLRVVQKASLDSEDLGLRDASTNRSPLLAHIAVAGNGHTAVIHSCDALSSQSNGGRVKSNSSGTLFSEFVAFSAFKAWYEDGLLLPDIQPHVHGHLPKPVQQLVAGATSFALLTVDGEVYTWGDARHNSLGRPTISREGQSTATLPGLVEALDGVHVRKICLGGWMFGAISTDGAAYIWGLDMPQAGRVIRHLKSLSADEDVALVVLNQGGSDEPDVADMDIGGGHAAVGTSDGELYVIGDNSSGQIGLGPDVESTADWVRVSDVRNVMTVVCGPRSTAVLCRP